MSIAAPTISILKRRAYYMRFFAGLWRVIALGLTASTITAAAFTLLEPNFNIEDAWLRLAVILGIAFILALSTIIRFVARCVRYRGFVGTLLIGLLAFVFATALTPIFLVISIFGRLGRLFCPHKAKPGARFAEDVREEINRDIWIASSQVAIKRILDREYDDDIKLDDGTEVTSYKQVALVRLSGRRYVLLSPINEETEAVGDALAYAITSYPGTDSEALVLVENESLYRRIYSVYDSLLAERAMFDS